jgi:cysteine desulfurase / selenocysteine lyase
MNASTHVLQPPAPLDLGRVREDFPILREHVHGKPLVYLDSAATAQKPQVVLDALDHYYRHDNANIHRGVHLLSERATAGFEGARETVRRFLNAAHAREIIFTRGTTEAINLVAHSYGRSALGPGDQIVLSAMEHHSNIVPWQLVCGATGARLQVVPMTDRGELQLEELDRLLGERTKLVALVHVSNALGTINPVREIIARVHARGIPVLLDGAQAVPHLPVDVRALDCDFYAFSGHKLYGPTGIGVLYGKETRLEAMPPWQGGGDMIRSVSFEGTTYNELPWKFEAGTPDIAGAIGLAAAIEYVEGLGLDAIAAHEHDLFGYAVAQLATVGGLRRVGTAREATGLVSFVMDAAHPHDIGTILDREGVAIRTGHHCCQPLMKRLGIPATARASFGVYNTNEDVDALVTALGRVVEVLG